MNLGMMTDCCYYRFKITKGIPHINMTTTTMHKHMKFYYQDLKFTYIIELSYKR